MHLRASVVALRSLHHRVDAVVSEIDGYPTFSIDTVRVVLPRGARHFRRVMPCAGCGAYVVEHGQPVRRRADLARASSVFCSRCSTRLDDG